ncbi:hypothetical protein J6590_048644 [Homalodisca vitripennis]|nr:hypothetical protein J6590_048644 [Homalodisca vitripennis]
MAAVALCQSDDKLSGTKEWKVRAIFTSYGSSQDRLYTATFYSISRGNSRTKSCDRGRLLSPWHSAKLVTSRLVARNGSAG